jgi:hypothetical protein
MTQPMTDHRAPVVVVAGVTYPATLSTGEAAAWLGCSPERLQAERGTGRLPVEPLALGRRLRWPTVLVARAIGLETEIVLPNAAGSSPNGARPMVDSAAPRPVNSQPTARKDRDDP